MIAVAPLRVFVVDDDRDTTECMRLLIGHWGHEVHIANDSALAIERAQVVKPDLMLVDLGMSAIDGLTVARRLREVSDLTKMSLVALTGYTDPQHRQQALDAGFDEYLVKPLPADALQALLSRVGSRVGATRDRSALAIETAAMSRDQADQARRDSSKGAEPSTEGDILEGSALGDHAFEARGDVIAVRLEKSGISDCLIVDNIEIAERVRLWLRQRGCRVGPVFELAPGCWAFYSYSRRKARAQLATHPRIRLNS
jgi:CheY-like chemotaxis protein